MSGIFHEGNFYENADLICRQCRTPLYEHYDYEGTFLCFSCGGEFDAGGADEQDAHYLPPVMVARHYDGITINTALEYILEDDNETARVFTNQPEAEGFLLSQGVPADDLVHLYFVECESEVRGRG